NRQWPKAEESLGPRGHLKQFDRELLRVVDVDNPGAGQVNRPPRWCGADIEHAAHQLLVLAFGASAEGDVKDPLVANAVVVRPGAAHWAHVLDKLDEHVAGFEHAAAGFSAGQSPDRLVLVGVQWRIGWLQSDSLRERRLRLREVGDR